mgnify:CR=1 FL=1
MLEWHLVMKKDLHPTDYRPVVFQDDAAGFAFLTQSTAHTNDTITWEDGNEYPLAKVEISAFTHPFFTGTMKIIDTAGRVERFQKRYGERKRKPGAAEVAEATPKAAEASE